MTKLSHRRRNFAALQPEDHILIGNRPYIVTKSAKGGMGRVLLLELDSNQAPRQFSVHGLRAALKGILPEVLSDASDKMFRRELAIWAGFRHPNVLALNEILDADADGWIAAMNCCNGSLRDYMRGKLLSVREATNIVGQILAGLDYAQRQDNVLHLDLKPENVLYDFLLNGRPNCFMISDWGISSVKQEQLNAIVDLPRDDHRRRETFNNMGTVLYMSPERFLKGYTSSIVSDVFSLGLIYLELISGRLPYTFSNDPVEELLSGTYLHIAEMLLRNARVPKSIRKLIFWCIEPHPDKRPRSYSDLNKALDWVCWNPTRWLERFITQAK